MYDCFFQQKIVSDTLDMTAWSSVSNTYKSVTAIKLHIKDGICRGICILQANYFIYIENNVCVLSAGKFPELIAKTPSLFLCKLF